MKKFIKLMLLGTLLLLLFSSYSSAFRYTNNGSLQNDEQEEPDGDFEIPINRKYLIAQIYGEISITDTCNYTKSLMLDWYRNIELNGTVTNSTLLNPFTIWPPISWIPFLRTIFLVDDTPVNLKINFFRGEFVPRNDNTTVRFYGDAYIIHVQTTINLNGAFNLNR